ncbi:DNA replication ATP-dependent helicase/nuclease JHS1 [Malania oleifera]|uniref:DNA replication ATP-dependent helicase/nuclease JHS1 n=1 Tax=Malania oleifera TaxID=397392 RepID=UPI0025AE4B3D|nr:DNA replication ATP-dependent helicase/nuclease JHS1 [Malania oleifera]XP_057980953.1 DNA replication ATP-dependent helicase/nuclease JHS1 [Malania oleifera]XP_057980954.1 DNA replication ATP-dependent helicase/nuclease JHS1 [Malania oleifera]
MAPRKKLTSSSSKKSNPNQGSQPSKFGIQHFFERHSQNHDTTSASQNPSKPSGTLQSLQNRPALTSATPNGATVSSLQNPRKAPNSRAPDLGNAASVLQNLENGLVSKSSAPREAALALGNRGDESNLRTADDRGALKSEVRDPKNAISREKNPKEAVNLQKTDTNNLSQNTPPENLMEFSVNANGNPLEESPEISKSVSVKRFKFSPGMLIKQSQDDGGDEVTWKISPVNERLQAMSEHMPEVMRALANASRMNSSNFRQCSQNKTSPASVGKLENWLSSPQLRGDDRSLVLANRVSSKRVSPDMEMDFPDNAIDANNSSVLKGQSPFRTPPSLSYCDDKFANIIAFDKASDQPGLRLQKKALLELLDQVEDVISVEESICNDSGACLLKVDDRFRHKMTVKIDPGTDRPATDLPGRFNRASSNLNFLVLEVSEKCKHTDSCGNQCSFKVLRLLNEQSGEERAVHLLDEWFYSVVAPGDTVHVIGEFNDQGTCEIDHENNLLVVHPDMLVSGTRVAASFSCPRRAVLDERLKCGEHSTAALIGTLLHQIFQAGLIKDVPRKDFLEEYARIVLQKNVESLYACGVNETDTWKTLIEAIPRILNWINLFKASQNSKVPAVDFGSDDGLKRINISEVIDIEEMAWAPKYGLKGMIDASLRIKVGPHAEEIDEKIVPLEFKTGKSTGGQATMEHTAQVILYTLLMSERYLKPIDSGLLYYLQTDQTQGIAVRRSDLVGLIMRRNELANDILKALTMQQLPPMLQSLSMCRGCRHLQFCTIYHKVHGGSIESSGLGDVFESNVNHLTTAHCAFLRHWNHLIDLEAKEMQVAKKRIWHSHSLKSDYSTNCLPSIVLDSSCELPQKPVNDNRFIYRFLRQDLPDLDKKDDRADSLSALPSPVNDLDCTLRAGDYVILSIESIHLAVASGVVTDINRFHVSVSFSKRLRLPRSHPSSEARDILQQVWRIDKDEAIASFALMRFNLVQLFLQNEQSSHLRKMIVDLEPPRFDSGCIFSQDPAISYVWSEKNLNNDQRRAILKILTAKDYALILGMPGTGKTSTMVHAVKALLMRGASILLTSYTNSAIDNLLIKLKAQGIDFARVGRHDAVHEEVRGNCFSAMNIQSVEDIKQRLDQVKVVAVTCLGITNPLLANKSFDICIMDEAGQTTLPVSLGPLMLASIFVLVGDHYQLPPLVQSTEARESGMGISLFCRLSEAHPNAISALQSQYRMCQGIMELSNALIYGNRLRCGSPEIENAKLKFSGSSSNSLWLKKVLDPRRPVIFINTDKLPAFEAKEHKTVNNPIEACIVAEITKDLVSSGIEGEDIGIITPYNSQASLIRHATVSLKSVEIHTIDKYQGRDKDCILVSFVRSSENPRNCISSLLGDWHRINVALTRAKKKLIMVGSCRTLSKVPLLKLLVENVEKQSGVLTVLEKDMKHQEGLKRCSQFR